MEFKNNKISFSKRAIAILMFFVFVAQSFVLNSSAISVFGATDPIGLKWTPTGDLVGNGYNFTTNNTGYDAYFSDARTMILNVTLNQPTQAGDSVEVNIADYLIFDSVGTTSASTFVTATPAWNSTTRTINLNLKAGLSGSFTLPITVHFDDRLSIHDETANITATVKNGTTVVGTPVVKTMKLYNDSKVNVKYTTTSANGDIEPGGWVIYNVWAITAVKLTPTSSYVFSQTNGIYASGSITYQMPNEATVVEVTAGNGTYDSIAKTVKLDFVAINNNPSNSYPSNANNFFATFRVKYDPNLVVGSVITAPGTPTVVLKTHRTTTNPYGNDRYDTLGDASLLSKMLLVNPIPSITGKVVANTQLNLTVGVYTNTTNTFYPGTDYNKNYATVDKGRGWLYTIGFKNTTPYDMTDVELRHKIPDGLYADGFKVPVQNSPGTTLWHGDLTVTFTTNLGRTNAVTVTPTSQQQWFTATQLNLQSNEHITELRLKFTTINSGDEMYKSLPPYAISTFAVLGHVDTNYSSGDAIKNNEDCTLTLDRYDKDSNLVQTQSFPRKFTTEKIISSGGSTDYYDLSTKNIISNNSYYPGSTFGLRLGQNFTAVYSNVDFLDKMVSYLILPSAFTIDVSKVSITDSYATFGKTPTIVEINNNDINSKGNKLYRIEVDGEYLNKYGPAGSDTMIPTSPIIYLPIKIDPYTPPQTFNLYPEMFYVSSEPGTLATWLSYYNSRQQDVYDFDDDGDRTEYWARIDGKTSANRTEFINVLPSGFQVFHQIKSAQQNVYKPSYTAGDANTVAHFPSAGAGTLNVQVFNNQPNAVNEFVYYDTLPSNGGVNPRIGLTGAIAQVSGFKYEYTKDVVPDRAGLTSGSTDTGYSDGTSFTADDWAAVTGFKIIATGALGTNTRFEFDVPIIMSATTKDSDYNTIVSSNAKVLCDGSTYSLSTLAADITEDRAAISGTVFFDVNGNAVIDGVEAGINGITVDLYDSSNKLIYSTITTTKNSKDGYYEFPKVIPGTYYTKYKVGKDYIKTSTTLPGFTGINLTQSAPSGSLAEITSDQFILTQKQVVDNADVGVNAPPKIAQKTNITAKDLIFEKVYDNKADDTAWDDYFKNLVDVTDISVASIDMSKVTINYGTFKDNMLINGLASQAGIDYPITYSYDNGKGGTATTVVNAKIVDTKAPTISSEVKNNLDLTVGDTLDPAFVSWQDYAENYFKFYMYSKVQSPADGDIQDNGRNYTIDWASFQDVNIKGSYTVKLDYTDPVGNKSAQYKVAINVQSSTPKITVKNDTDLFGKGFVLEKVYEIDSIGNDDAYFKGLVDVTDGYPVDLSQLTVKYFDVSNNAVSADTIKNNMEKNGVRGDYKVEYTYTNVDGEQTTYSILIRIKDETPALIEEPTDFAIKQGTSLEGSSVTDYIVSKGAISVTDIQDDFDPSKLVLGLGAFNPNVAGVYTVTVDYTDPANNISIQKDVVITVTSVDYIVTWELDNGAWKDSAIPQTTVNHGGTVLVPAEAEKEAFTFDGWYADAEFNQAVSFPVTNVTSDVTYYAKWKPIVYTVTWVTNGGGPAPTQITVDYNGTVETPTETIIKNGYTFDGWYTDESLTQTASLPESNVKSNKIYYAKWTEIQGEKTRPITPPIETPEDGGGGTDDGGTDGGGGGERIEVPTQTNPPVVSEAPAVQEETVVPERTVVQSSPANDDFDINNDNNPLGNTVIQPEQPKSDNTVDLHDSETALGLNKVKAKQNPKTGDDVATMFVTVVLAAGALLMGLVLGKKKEIEK